LIRAAEARTTFGVSGAGVRVGLISDTFTDRTTGRFAGSGCSRTFTSTASSRDELPGEVYVLAEPEDLTGANFNGIDEGRALAELVYDLAPGAQLYYHTAFTTQSIFAQAIEELVACGVDLLVDDVIYFSEPMFQDGIVAQAAADAVAQGVPFFSAVGNLGPWGVDEFYEDSDPSQDDMENTPTGVDLHRFGNGTRFAPVVIPRGCGLRMILQWNEPFDGALGEGATSDLDLYACAADNPFNCLASTGARDSQGCSTGAGPPARDPIEILDVTSRSNDRTVYIAVEHVCGNENLRFRIVSFALGCNFPNRYEFDPLVFNKSQAYGHPVGDGVIGTAAVFYQEIDSDGANQDDPETINVEPFSSSGGLIPIYFDRNGDALPNGPLVRISPQLAAPDGTNTSFFGLFDAEGDDLLNFFGTSAAAPHAAAVAALMLEANPALSTAETLAILQETSIDIEDPGFDFRSGAGLIDAVDAVAAAIARATSPPSATATATATPTASSTHTAAATRTPVPCTGDCDRNGGVSVAELVRGVRINLGSDPLAWCPPIDHDADGAASVAELTQAVNANLLGCAG
jgi:subtilisin family serine protease